MAAADSAGQPLPGLHTARYRRIYTPKLTASLFHDSSSIISHTESAQQSSLGLTLYPVMTVHHSTAKTLPNPSSMINDEWSTKFVLSS